LSREALKYRLEETPPEAQAALEESPLSGRLLQGGHFYLTGVSGICGGIPSGEWRSDFKSRIRHGEKRGRVHLRTGRFIRRRKVIAIEVRLTEGKERGSRKLR